VLSQVWSRRSLLAALTYRQYQLRYRQSVVGFVWAIIPLLATLIAATVVFHGVAKVNTGNVPYPLFLLASLVPWTFFSSSIGQGVPSIVGSSSMISKLAFPRAVIPFTQVGLALIDLGVSIVIFLVYLLATGRMLPPTAVWFFPLLLIEMVLVLGITMLGSAMNVFARDIKLAVPAALQFWLLLTPVMYPLSRVPASLRPLFILNPMTGLAVAFRNVLIHGIAPNFPLLIPAVVGAVFLFAAGTWYFRSTETRFADVV
jgi:lipopolysaccharide transport system permease protein